MWGQIISAGANIISSLFGKKKSSNRINYKAMVRDAEAAGFNPLTALRNGGSAGYMQTSTPSLSAGEVIGEAAGAIGNYLSNFDPMADDKRQAEYDLVQAQIANLNASTSAIDRQQAGRSFNVPTRSARSVEDRPSGQAGQLSARPLPASAGAPVTPTVETPTVTNPWPTSLGWRVNPDLPDASAWEERYGEPGDWVGGALTFGGDVATFIYDWQQGLKRRTDERRKSGPGKPFNRSDRLVLPPLR